MKSRQYKNAKGYTLAELLVAIIVLVLGITAGVYMAKAAMESATVPEQLGIASSLAEQRMALIMTTAQAEGFDHTPLDPCTLGSPPAVCSAVPSNYTVSASITTLDPNHKKIQVSVTAPDVMNNADLTTMIARLQ